MININYQWIPWRLNVLLASDNNNNENVGVVIVENKNCNWDNVEMGEYFRCTLRLSKLIEYKILCLLKFKCESLSVCERVNVLETNGVLTTLLYNWYLTNNNYSNWICYSLSLLN